MFRLSCAATKIGIMNKKNRQEKIDISVQREEFRY